jgi:hypothetical protein
MTLHRSSIGLAGQLMLAVSTLLLHAVPASAQEPPHCAAAASDACYFSFEPAGANGSLHYYASRAPGDVAAAAPTTALIAVHGHPRDANTTFDAAWLAAQRAGVSATTLVVAPVFQVDAAAASKCRTAGVPPDRSGDLLWTCGSWLAGAASLNGNRLGAFAALDALVAELRRQWPSLHTVTIAGFSAGAQMVQHAIGFAAAPEAGLTLRYVVSDPGSWLYFDALRPQPMQRDAEVDWPACKTVDDAAASPSAEGRCTLRFVAAAPDCAAANRWKYGTDDLPAVLGRSAAAARARYVAADISYLEAALDSDAAPGTAYKVLDKSCGAAAQGPYRLQRGLAYGAYDRDVLAPPKARPVTVVPGCAHSVACVFPAPEARAALFGAAR